MHVRSLVAVAVATALLAGCTVPRPGGDGQLRYRDQVFSDVRALKVDRPPSAVAARAVNVQLKAMPADVANGLEWKFAEHACDVERGNSRIIGLH